MLCSIDGYTNADTAPTLSQTPADNGIVISQLQMLACSPHGPIVTPSSDMDLATTVEYQPSVVSCSLSDASRLCGTRNVIPTHSHDGTHGRSSCLDLAIAIWAVRTEQYATCDSIKATTSSRGNFSARICSTAFEQVPIILSSTASTRTQLSTVGTLKVPTMPISTGTSAEASRCVM